MKNPNNRLLTFMTGLLFGHPALAGSCDSCNPSLNNESARQRAGLGKNELLSFVQDCKRSFAPGIARTEAQSQTEN
jgi:hypothetical protein